MGLSEKIIKTAGNLEFSNSISIAKSKNITRKIIKYSDLRVSPHGIDTLTNRLAEARKRYVNKSSKWTDEEFDNLSNVWFEIEKEIFAKCSLNPSDITNKKAESMIELLRKFEISTK